MTTERHVEEILDAVTEVIPDKCPPLNSGVIPLTVKVIQTPNVIFGIVNCNGRIATNTTCESCKLKTPQILLIPNDTGQVQ